MMPRPPFQPALSFPLFALRHRRRRRRIHIQLPLILYIRRLTLAVPDSPFPPSLPLSPPLLTFSKHLLRSRRLLIFVLRLRLRQESATKVGMTSDKTSHFLPV